MPRHWSILILIGHAAVPVDVHASYQMFCELEGEVVSTPVFAESIEFEYQVTTSREIEVELLGVGWSDCDRLEGKTVKVFLAPEDAGKQTEIVAGARLLLHRYEIDVILRETGEYVRSVKHVRVD